MRLGSDVPVDATDNMNVLEWDTGPLVAVTLTEYVPLATERLDPPPGGTVRVITTLPPEPDTDDGLIVTVGPEGETVPVSTTCPEKPFKLEMNIVTLFDEP